MHGVRAQPLIRRHRYTVADYYRMAEVGVLTREHRVELVDGAVLTKEPNSPRHARCIRFISQRLHAALAEEAILAVHDPLRIDDHNEPEPDLMVLHARQDWYRDAHPVPHQVHLLIEVSEAHVRYDREVKLPLYAKAGITEVWIVDLPAGVLRRHREPWRDEYGVTQLLTAPGLLPVPGLCADGVDLTGLLV
jgi:Uma2 family endonuclease